MRDGLGGIQTLVVLGGGSEIGLATARRLVADGCRTVVLGVRSVEDAAGAAAELRSAGARTVDVVEFDAERTDTHAGAIREIAARHGDIDCALLAFGRLGAPAAIRDPEEAAALVRLNGVGGVSAAVAVAEQLRLQGHGALVVLSSAGAVRPRASVAAYAAGKAALDGFALALNDDLVGSGARVIVVRPGFVRTRMTAGLKVPPLATTADAVAAAIATALAGSKTVVWVPGTMRLALLVLSHLPRALFRRVGV